MKTLTDASFPTDVLACDLPVLVDFWAPWCGPCKAIAPVLDALEPHYAGKVIFAKINVDDNPQSAGKFGIRGIPALMLFKNGKPVSTLVGANPEAAMRKWLDSNA